MKKVCMLLFILVTSVVFAGCLETPDTATDSDFGGTQIESSVDATTGEVITVKMSNYRFTPNIIRAKAGTTLKLKITDNQGSHDFVIDELNVDSGIFQTGESKEIMIEIPAADAGKTFEFYCSVMNHRQMGMVGQLIIE